MDLLTVFCTIFGFLHMIVFITVEYNKTETGENTCTVFVQGTSDTNAFVYKREIAMSPHSIYRV